MNESLIKLRFTLDRLSLRERISILAASMTVVLTIWYFLVYSTQTAALSEANTNIMNQETQVLVMTQKRKSIESLAADNTQQKLVAKFNKMKEEMQVLDTNITRYEQRFISTQVLAKLLYSLLKQVGGVTIDGFSNVDTAQTEPVKVADTASGAAKVETKQLPEAVNQRPVQHAQYTLTLKGDYFSILNYLKQLEKIPWQLYWDKLDYQVINYPVAVATVEFYTLRPAEVQEIDESGALK